MKKLVITSCIIIVGFVSSIFGQFTTGSYHLGVGTTVRIDTSPTTVTLTLKGESTRWLGVGFGASATTMSTCTDMFIWNDTPDRDFTPTHVGNDWHYMPVPDVDQSWTIVSDTVTAGLRTVVATRALVSAGDFTFLNNSSFLQIIYAQGDTTTLAYHGTNSHNTTPLNRDLWLAVEDFSINAPSIYPNPSKGSVTVQTKTGLDTIVIYNQTGAVVQTIAVNSKKEGNEVAVNGLATGVYIFKLQNGTEKTYKNVVVE